MHMRAGAARSDLSVLERQAAEGDHQPGVLDDRRPIGDAAAYRRKGADHVRQQELRRAPAVIAGLIDAAAAEEQEPPHQRARVMQPPRRRPAVGAAENRPTRRSASRTRSISPATRSSAPSHDTSSNSSAPVRGRPSRQPLRTAGRAIRSGECTIAGIASSIGEGAGSRANGSQATTRPSSTRAVKAPQCARDGKRPTVMGLRSFRFRLPLAFSFEHRRGRARIRRRRRHAAASNRMWEGRCAPDRSTSRSRCNRR